MKVISLIVAVIIANVAFVWAIIEFILFLVKDKEFNWWSVWIFVISAVVAIILNIIVVVTKVKQRNRTRVDMKQHQVTEKKSKFQERLEEMRNTK